MNNKYESLIHEFINPTTAKSMIIFALKELRPIKGSRFAFGLSISLGLVFGIKIGLDNDTVICSIQTIEIILNILLTLFTCIFAVYSILLAFFSDSYIKKLSEIDYDNDESFLKKSITYYETVLFQYFIAIGITGVLLIALNCIEPNWVLTVNHVVNNSLAIVLLVLYFSFVFRIFYELKSAIYNTIVLFRASIAYKLLAFAQNEKEGQHDDNFK